MAYASFKIITTVTVFTLKFGLQLIIVFLECVWRKRWSWAAYKMFSFWQEKKDIAYQSCNLLRAQSSIFFQTDDTVSVKYDRFTSV